MKTIKPELLDRPRTVKELAVMADCSESKVRKWIKEFIGNVSVGHTKPRKYWISEQEDIRKIEEFSLQTAGIAARNQFCAYQKGF